MSKKKRKKKTTLPNNVDEAEFLQVIDNISRRLGHKFKFGYHSFEDMKQQCAIFALEGLEKYDNKRPLENFLWIHVRNRLFNFKRDNYQRPDKPCFVCKFYDAHCSKSVNQCLEYSDKNNCEEYTAWNNRNTNKKNIMKPVGIEDLKETQKSFQKNYDIAELVTRKQIIRILDEHVPAPYRETYLRLKYGERIYKSDLNKLLEITTKILEEHNYDIEKDS